MTDKKNSLVAQAAALLGGTNEQVTTGGGATGKAIGPTPVAAAGGDSHKNRPQDKGAGMKNAEPSQNPAGTPVEATPTENNVKPTGDTSAANRASVAMKAVREDIDAMFAGSDVSEEFKTKAETIFEAAVNARVTAVKEQLETENQTALEEAVAAVQEDLEGKLDEYLQYTTEQWLEQNAVAVESGLRADIAESFMKGLHQLFTDHHIDVPEEQVNVAEELATEVDELKELLNKAVNDNIELKKLVTSADRVKVVESVTAGLVETQKEKLSKLFEGVDFTTAEEFKTKLVTIKEGYLSQGTTADKKTSVQNLLEEIDETPAGTKAALISDPAVRNYVDAISRTMPRK